ncbi:MAG: hypothetical protein V4656_16220 [Pseudomonadota bacterium]
MDYVPIQPGPRRAPASLIVMSVLEVLLALAAAWVALTRISPSQIMDHREVITTVAGGTLPLALLAAPLLAWIAFLRRADGAIWPLLWSPGTWALLIIAGSL